MQKHLLIITVLLLFGFTTLKAGGNPPASLSGTYLVGNSQPVYKKLTDVAAALNNAANTVTGNVIFELDSDYEGYMGETFPITFNQFNSSGSWTVTIRPKAGVSMRKTSGDPGGGSPLIMLNGTDRLVLDGRPGGSGSSTRWLIRSTATSSAGNIFLQNDAQNNILTYLQLEGQARSSAGVVVIGGTNLSAGNNNNNVSYCTIRDRTDAPGGPATGILLAGDATRFNLNNIITHNNIFNFGWGYSASGIALNNSPGTEITDNNIYQEQPVSIASGDANFYGINSSDRTLSNTVIRNNYIGGSAPGCAGSPFSVTSAPGSYLKVTGISINPSGTVTGTGNVIDNNTIRNFTVVSDIVQARGHSVFLAILAAAGGVSVTNNKVGSPDRNDDIRFTVQGGTSEFKCSIIGVLSNQASVTGNSVGGITVDGASLNATFASTLNAIEVKASPTGNQTFDISNNLIGSTALTNSIRSVSAVMPLSFYGITTNIAAPGYVTYQNNTISGVDLGYTGTTTQSFAMGLSNGNAGGSATIDHNTISDIGFASRVLTLSSNFMGIWSAGAATEIHDNTVRGLRLTGDSFLEGSAGFNTFISGIYLNGTGTFQVYNNKVYDFSSVNNLGTASASVFYGIDAHAPATLYNNLISLDNGTRTNNCQIRGVQAMNVSAGIKVFHNTVYIGGDNGGASNTAFSAAIGRTNGAGPFLIRNNLLVNTRTGGSGAHYLYYVPETTPSTNWPAVASNYNVLVTATIGRIAKWGNAEKDTTQWKITGGDVSSRFYTTSQIAPSDLFTDIGEADLSIKEAARQYVAAKGTSGTGIITDYAGQTRSTTAPSAGAYEYTAEPAASPLAGTFLVGNSQPVYKKLTDVAAALNDSANIVTGDLIFELDGDYLGYEGETFPIVFRKFNSSGNWTVTIRPKADVSIRKTSGDPGSTNPLIVLDGTNRLILDGRAGGTGGINWLVRNIADASAGTVFLQNDAQDNTLTWLQLEGQSTATSGVVVLGASQTTGNDNNTISYCDIRNRSDVAGAMTCGILSLSVPGDIATSNSGNVITHNNIFNFYRNGGAAYGIRLMGGTDMQITHNNFYQTQAITGAAARTGFYAVSIEQAAVANMIISNNFIGGSAPGCTGDLFSVTGVNVSFTAINFNSTGADAGAGNSVNENTIRNFDLIADAASTEGIFTAIQSRTGRVDITNNTIGSSVDNDAIKLMVKGGTRRVNCTIIILYSKKGGTVSGNTIGGITIGGNPNATEAGKFTAITAGAEPAGAINFDISNNIVGSTTVSNNIRSISTVLPLDFTGISGDVYSPGNINYRNNTIAGIAMSYSGTSIKTSVMGIVNGTSEGTATIDSNTIADISSASLTPNLQPIVCGILAVGKSVVSNNTIRGLRLTGTGPIGSSSYGTIIAGIRGGDEATKVYNNRIYDLSSVNGTGASSYTGLWGIEVASSCTIYNNLISLDNGSNTNNSEIKGIQTNEFPSAAKVFHNTIYIGGANGATSNTASSAPIGRPWSGGSYAQIRNNILINARTGGSGAHYLFYNYTRGGNPATGWTTATSDNNLLVTGAMDKVARWGTTDLDSTQWKTTGGDQHSRFYTISRIQPASLFVNTSTGDLAIKAGAQRYVAGKGIAGTGITTDLAMHDRSTTSPSLGAYEYPVPNNTAEPVITSHSGAASVSLQIPENTIAVTTVTATDADMTDVLTYSLVDEEDAGRFAVNPSTGELNFIAAPDFEMPGDSNGDNIYIVTVQVSDGELTATQRFKLKVIDANDHAPVITSYNGDISVSLRVEENTTATLATVRATDADKNPVITYSIVDEEDGGKFSVNPAAGELKFITAPDFDQPGDIGGDNIYIVTVKASDGDSSATQRFKIKITDLNDNAPVFTSHSGNAEVSLSLPENTRQVTTVAATDGDGTAVTYSLLNEEDGALFSLNAAGQLSFITAPDFEHPADANHDNIYIVSVKASDGSLSAVQRFTITITDLNDNLPMITTSMRVPENTVEVAELDATDADAGSQFTIDILNQEDGALFWVNPANGWLEFRSAPDFEQPADTDHDNTYLVLIKIADGDFSFILRLKVKVTNVDETAGRSSGATAKNSGTPQEKTNVQTDTESGKGIRAYPNPVTGKRFTLQINDGMAGKYILELYTLAGQLVYRQPLQHVGDSKNYPVQLRASLTRGTYVLKLAGAGVIHTEKLIVE